ncbi:enoyl-CoA hydratase/isomerase family protein [Pseudochelatococcus sp. B33]
MADDENLVTYERRGRIGYITLNRPDKLNAFSDDAVIALKDRLWEFDRDEEAWVGILSGNGRAFSSGADVRQRQLRERAEFLKLGGPSGRGATHHPIMFEGHLHWKPVIAAVHGYVFGMAVGITLRCDYVIADCDTAFEVTETRRGLYAGQYWSIMQFRGAGTFADEVFLSGRRFTGAEAAEKGVINRSVEPGTRMAAAEAFAGEILKNPPLSVRAMVRARRWHLQQHERQHTLFYEAAKLHLTEDFEESARAFAEKRPPKEYVGR